jgi:hypothetical protein
MTTISGADLLKSSSVLSYFLFFVLCINGTSVDQQLLWAEHYLSPYEHYLYEILSKLSPKEPNSNMWG